MGLETSSPPLHRWFRNRARELRGKAPACNTAGHKAYPAMSGITTLGFWILLQGFHSWRKRRSCRPSSGATREVSGQPGQRRLPGSGKRNSAGGSWVLRPTRSGSAWPPGWLEGSKHAHSADLDSLAVKRGPRRPAQGLPELPVPAHLSRCMACANLQEVLSSSITSSEGPWSPGSSAQQVVPRPGPG